MPNTIPPLVCNTPPPIDDLESDDELSAPNDCNDHFDDESLPPSPLQQSKQQNAADTILIRNSLSPSPVMKVTHKPAATNTTAAESPISFELELESPIVNDGLDSQSSAVVADDELQFDSDNKMRTGSDSAIGDVYSNGQCSNSSILTSKETDTSNSSVDLKRSETLPDHNEQHISAYAEDCNQDDGHDGGRNEYNCENALAATEQSDNLSSSPSWNLDGQTPEPEFNSFSCTVVPGDLSSIEHSSITMIASTEHHTDTVGLTDDYHHPNTEISLNDMDDDDLAPTPMIVNPPMVVDDSISKANDDVSSDECAADDMGAIKFNADFGQFATFADEHFDDAAIESKPAPIAAVTAEPTNICDNNEINVDGGQANNDNDFDDDDDEFGEFNDFQQMPAVQTTAPVTVAPAAVDTALHRDVAPSANVLLDSENIKHNLSSILNAIFPADKQNCDAATTASDSHYTYEKQQFINNLTVQLRNVENSHALNHQWAKSTSKTLLVKALGIDSRNILYGEKWNSSAPKFAANLGLSPLEPMKVTTLSATSKSTPSPSTLNTVETDVKGHKSILDVPAAQFDWNSSGLINPLDALHAHTLLLDLEQLVVVANLDKINLNSSSSACSTTNLAQNYQTSISKQQQQQPTNATATATATTSLPSSTFTSQPFGQMVSALPLNESKLAKITNQRSTTTTTPSSTSSSSLFSSSNTTTLDQLNQFHKTNFLKCTNGNHTMRHDTNHVKPLVTGNPFDSYFRAQTSTHEDQLPLDHQKGTSQRAPPPSKSLAPDLLPQLVAPIIPAQPLSAPVLDTVSMVHPTKPHSLDDVHSEEIAPEIPSPTSDSYSDSYSYTVPGSSGTMKETYIFTPITPKSVANIVGTVGSANDTATTVPIPPSVAVTTNVNTEPIAPSLIPNGISNDIEPFQSDTIVIKENVVKKEYRDVEYEPNKFVANASADDFTEFQFVQPSPSMPDANPIIEQNLNTTNALPNIQSPAVNFLTAPSDRSISSFDSLSSIPTIDSISADATLKPTTNSGNQPEFDLYSLNKSSFPPSSIEPFDRTPDPMEIFSIQHSHSSFEQSPQSTINQVDIQQANTKQNSHHNNNNHISSITGSTSMPLPSNNNNTIGNSMNSYIGGGSSILMPQMANNVQSKQATAVNNALTIQWPEPGINTDQLEQLEARFNIQPDANVENDTKKDSALAPSSSTADDEWSDFVSVVQPQTPITNILNKNLLKHQNNDEDDWSEFVSSTPPPPNSLQQFAPLPQSTLLGIGNANNSTVHTNYNNVFKPWTINTAPFPPKSHNTAAYHSNSTFDGYAKSSNAQRYVKTVNTIANGDSNHAFPSVMQKSATAAPSIISLPDLGFVAPKSLVNMPNRTLAKK